MAAARKTVKVKAKPQTAKRASLHNLSSGFEWDERRITAATAIASGYKTDSEAATEAGVSRQALTQWKAQPAFQQRVQEIRDELVTDLKIKGVREKSQRLANLQKRIDKMLTLIDARGEDMADEIAGGETGLLVRDYKGSAPHFQPVYRFDAALLKELREHEKQAAIEVGEWTERKEVTGSEGSPLLAPLADALEKVYGGSK